MMNLGKERQFDLFVSIVHPLLMYIICKLVSITPDFTTQEFFDKHATTIFSHACADMVNTCFGYLLAVNRVKQWDFSDRYTDGEEQFSKENPFYDYAARKWGHHTNVMDDKLCEQVITFLTCNSPYVRQSFSYILHSELYSWSELLPSFGDVGLYLAIYRNYDWALPALLDKMDAASSHNLGVTPLALAARIGQANFVQGILDRCCADSRRAIGIVKTGHQEIKEIYGIDTIDTECRTPFVRRWKWRRTHCEAAA
jgi:hypothetical protein